MELEVFDQLARRADRRSVRELAHRLGDRRRRLWTVQGLARLRTLRAELLLQLWLERETAYDPFEDEREDLAAANSRGDEEGQLRGRLLRAIEREEEEPANLKKTKEENSFLTYGGNGVRLMGKRGRVGELKKNQRRTSPTKSSLGAPKRPEPFAPELWAFAPSLSALGCSILRLPLGASLNPCSAA